MKNYFYMQNNPLGGGSNQHQCISFSRFPFTWWWWWWWLWRIITIERYKSLVALCIPCFWRAGRVKNMGSGERLKCLELRVRSMLTLGCGPIPPAVGNLTNHPSIFFHPYAQARYFSRPFDKTELVRIAQRSASPTQKYPRFCAQTASAISCQPLL